MPRDSKPKSAKKAQDPTPQKGCAPGGCGGFDEVCSPEPYAYRIKYFCEATPCDFKIWRGKCDSPCCPAPYKYEYTVKVVCAPGKCEAEPTPCPPQPCPQEDSFPQSFSTSGSGSAVEKRSRRRS